MNFFCLNHYTMSLLYNSDCKKNIKTMYHSSTDAISNEVKNAAQLPGGNVPLGSSIPKLENALILGLYSRATNIYLNLEDTKTTASLIAEFKTYVEFIQQWCLNGDIGRAVNQILQVFKNTLPWTNTITDLFKDAKFILCMLSKFYNLDNCDIPTELVEEYSKLFGDMSNREKFNLSDEISKIIHLLDVLMDWHLCLENEFSDFINSVKDSNDFKSFFDDSDAEICLYHDICKYFKIAKPGYIDQLKFYMAAVDFKTHLYAMSTAVNTDLPDCKCGDALDEDCSIHYRQEVDPDYY
jgi:hypothetical protein